MPNPIRTRRIFGGIAVDPISWLLKDEFNDIRSAGLVNGSMATPKGGVRTVVDTTSKLTINNGTANFSTGVASAGDPGIFHPIVIRQKGRTLLYSFLSLTSDGNKFAGFNNAQSGQPMFGAVYFHVAGNIYFTSGAIYQRIVGSYSTGENYKIAFVMRGSGSFFFIKGGSYTNWTMLMFDSYDSSDRYPNMSFGTGSGKADFVHIPTDLIKVAPIASDSFSRPITTDTFDRSNGLIGSTDKLVMSESGQVSYPWSGSTFSISGNKSINNPLFGSELIIDGGFESWNSAIDSTNWIEQILAGTSSANRESTIKHSGLYSLRLDIDSSLSAVTSRQSVPVVAGTWICVNSWLRSSIIGAYPRLAITGKNFEYNPGTTWQNYNSVFRFASDNDAITLTRGTGSGSSSLYFDDISVKALSLPSLFSTIQIVSPLSVAIEAILSKPNGTQAGFVMCLDSATNPQNFVIGYHDGSYAIIEKCVNGIYTTLASVFHTPGSSFSWKMTRAGTGFAIYSGSVLANVTVSDSSIISNTLHGIFSTNQENTFDNFAIFRYYGALNSVPTVGNGSEEKGGDGLVWNSNSWVNNYNTVAYNTPVTGSELVTDGGMEIWIDANNLTNWTKSISGTSSINKEAVVKHSGSYSARLDIDSLGSNGQILQASQVPINSWCVTSWWGRSSEIGKRLRIAYNGFAMMGPERDPGITWTNYIDIWRQSSSSGFGFIRVSGASSSSSLYVDDVSIKALTLSSLFASLQTSKSDILIEVVIPSMIYGTQAGLVLNIDDANNPQNFVIAYQDRSNVRLEKCVGGVYTTLINTAAALTSTGRLIVSKDGTQYRVYYNDVLIGSEQTISDIGIVNNTLHGMFSTYSANTFDDFVIWPRGTSGEYNELFDKYTK